MSQFDLEADAALTQLNFERISETPGAEFAEIIGDLLMLIGTGGLWAVAGGASNLMLKVRRLAGASYVSNLIYAITAVRNDLKRLFDEHAELRERIEHLPTDPKFAEAIGGLSLRVMQTSLRNRLERLAKIVVNGVRDGDLESESLDDMMRAAVELKEIDLQLLSKIYEAQSSLLKSYRALFGEWAQQVAHGWADRFGCLDTEQWKGTRGALARLQAFGFIQAVTTNVTATGELRTQPFGLLPEGAKFWERIQEISAAT
jgi:hypothetical protein